MKLKSIKKLLAARFNLWANSITDENLRKKVIDGTIITGGSIVSLLQNEKPNDFDLYFRDRSTCLAVAEYYAKFFPGKVTIWDGLPADPDRGIPADPQRISIRTTPDIVYMGDEEASDESPELKEDEKFEPVFMSSNAITLSGQIQIVVRFFGQPEEIHANYDFVHCTSYWKSWDEELVTPLAALQSIMTKELNYVGSKYPLCSLIRLRKFIARGWTINAGQMLKVILQLNELDLFNIAVLQEQLVGVDSAYFAQLLEALEGTDPAKLNAAYISEIIDRIF